MPQTNTVWKKVLESARKEGRVRIYSAARGNPVTSIIAERFRSRYGLDIEFIEQRTEITMEKIRQELVTGTLRADVTINGATALYSQIAHKHVAPPGPLPNAALLAPQFITDTPVIPIFVVHYGILANTNLVPPDERPTAWMDLLHPRWRDRILCDDFREVGAGAVLFSSLLSLHGEFFHRSFAAQRPCFSLASRALEQRVAKGEFALFTPFTMPNLADLAGLSVIGYVPAEGAPCMTFGAALLTGAPRPNAARVFLDFLLSPEIQAAYRARNFGPVIKNNCASGAPALLPAPQLETLNERLQLARMIYEGIRSVS